MLTEFVCPHGLQSSVARSSITNCLWIITKCLHQTLSWLCFLLTVFLFIFNCLSASLPQKLFQELNLSAFYFPNNNAFIIKIKKNVLSKCLSFITFHHKISEGITIILFTMSLVFFSLLASICGQSLYHQFSIEKFSGIQSSSFL